VSADEETEREYLERYVRDERDRYPHAGHTVDVALFTIRDGHLSLLLVRRGDHPEKGRWALPGGFVELGGSGAYGEGESLDEAAQRELLEETGVDVFRGYLEQLRTYGDPHRDRRGRVFSTTYVAMMPNLAVPRAGSDAAAARYFPVEDLAEAAAEGLAFDHEQIIADALERVRGKIEYEGRLAASFIEEPFTISELRKVYEAVWGAPVHRADFRRKVLSAKDFLAPTGGATPRTGGPPAQLYRLGAATLLYPPMQRRGMLLDAGRDEDEFGDADG
jgi:8-oxo-dGTP diphosphatase